MAVGGRHEVQVQKEVKIMKEYREFRSFRVYGREGHRQRESFHDSYTLNIPERDVTITVSNADETGTSDYTLVGILAPTMEDVMEEMRGQLSDGIFENSRVGRVVPEVRR